MPPRVKPGWKRYVGRTAWLISLALASTASIPGQSLKQMSSTAFAAEIAGFGQLARRCAANAGACDGSAIPDSEQVDGSPGGSFQISWGWLQAALGSAKTASTSERMRAMLDVQHHLSALAAQAGVASSGTAAVEFAKARIAADAALARDEFRAAVEGPSWFDRQVARLQDAILRLFSGVGRLGQRAPWLAPLIEWSCFGLAAAGLLWFVRQSLARQALRISLGEGAAPAGRGEWESADWARLAEERAAAQDWREAVHCLYWAAIALLESRRAWKPNSTRTPREYIHLLRPGSHAHTALRDLTRQFERVWYGYADAQAAQYESARDSYRALEAAKPERTAALDQRNGDVTAMASGLGA